MWTRSSRLAAISIVLLAGCGGSECKVENVEYTKSVNATGYAGATQGVTVARFDLTQNFVTHTPYAACAQGPLRTSVSSRSPSRASRRLPCSSSTTSRGSTPAALPVWSHADTIGVTIAPNETLAVGQISTSHARLWEPAVRACCFRRRSTFPDRHGGATMFERFVIVSGRRIGRVALLSAACRRRLRRREVHRVDHAVHDQRDARSDTSDRPWDSRSRAST